MRCRPPPQRPRPPARSRLVAVFYSSFMAVTSKEIRKCARAIGPICDTRNEYLFDSRLIQTDSRSSRSVRRVGGVKSTLLREAINSFTAGMSLFDISCGTVRKKEAIAAERAGAGADKAGGGERAAGRPDFDTAICALHGLIVLAHPLHSTPPAARRSPLLS